MLKIPSGLESVNAWWLPLFDISTAGRTFNSINRDIDIYYEQGAYAL